MTNTEESPDHQKSAGKAACGGAVFSRLGWVLAICLAVVAAYLGGMYVSARTEISMIRLEADMARMRAEELEQQLEAERIINAHEIASLKKAVESANVTSSGK